MNKQIDEQMDSLRALVPRHGNGRLETGIPRVAMVRGAIPEHELAIVYEPMINLILQGSREYARLFGMAPLRDAARMLAHTRNA
ncbi:MAG: hypothetical protein ACRYGK_15975 [Janthinobacterium lividum]